MASCCGRSRCGCVFSIGASPNTIGECYRDTSSCAIDSNDGGCPLFEGNGWLASMACNNNWFFGCHNNRKTWGRRVFYLFILCNSRCFLCYNKRHSHTKTIQRCPNIASSLNYGGGNYNIWSNYVTKCSVGHFN